MKGEAELQAWFENIKAEFDLNFIQGNRWRFLLTGLGNTLQITLMALVLGLVVGMLIAGVRSSVPVMPPAEKS